jgi:hypothetical protein
VLNLLLRPQAVLSRHSLLSSAERPVASKSDVGRRVRPRPRVFWAVNAAPDHRTPWARTRSHRPRTGSAGATGASCTCSRCPGDGQVLPAHAKLPVSADSDEWVISTHNAARTSIHQRARLGATTSGQCQLTGGHRIHQASANKELWVAVMGHIPTMRPKNWAVPRW